MAISPLRPITERVTISEEGPMTSRTYSIFEKKKSTRTALGVTSIRFTYTMPGHEVGGIIDGLDAIRQFIRKTIATARYHYRIYGDGYGCELEDLIGQDVTDEFLKTEIPRIIRDALIYDDRIRDVNNFVLRREGDALYVSFSVETVEGVIKEEVVV